MIDYARLVQYFAKEEWQAEVDLQRHNEAILGALKLQCSRLRPSMDGDRVARSILLNVLRSPGHGLPSSVIPLLLRSEASPASTSVDLNSLLWRCAYKKVFRVLDKSWFHLYSAWKSLDAAGKGWLDAHSFRSGLLRSEAGLSRLQVDILMRQVLVEDGTVDYRSVLRGEKLRGPERYCNPALDTWLALESDDGWNLVAQCVKDAFSPMNGTPVNALNSPIHGPILPSHYFLAYLLQQANKRSGWLPGLTKRGLQNALDLLDPTGSGEVHVDEATWIVCGHKLRAFLLSGNTMQWAGSVLDHFRQELAARWDKLAQKAGLQEYEGGDDHFGQVTTPSWKWGLPISAAESCVRKALRNCPFANDLIVGALVRKARAATTSLAVNDPDEVALVSELGLTAVLHRILNPETIFSRLTEDLETASGASNVSPHGMQSSDAIESGTSDSRAPKLRECFQTMITAAKMMEECWTQESAPSSVMPSTLHAAGAANGQCSAPVLLQGICLVSNRSHDSVWPAPIKRSHMRKYLEMGDAIAPTGVTPGVGRGHGQLGVQVAHDEPTVREQELTDRQPAHRPGDQAPTFLPSLATAELDRVFRARMAHIYTGSPWSHFWTERGAHRSTSPESGGYQEAAGGGRTEVARSLGPSQRARTLGPAVGAGGGSSGRAPFSRMTSVAKKSTLSPVSPGQQPQCAFGPSEQGASMEGLDLVKLAELRRRDGVYQRLKDAASSRAASSSQLVHSDPQDSAFGHTGLVGFPEYGQGYSVRAGTAGGARAGVAGGAQAQPAYLEHAVASWSLPVRASIPENAHAAHRAPPFPSSAPAPPYPFDTYPSRDSFPLGIGSPMDRMVHDSVVRPYAQSNRASRSFLNEPGQVGARETRDLDSRVKVRQHAAPGLVGSHEASGVQAVPAAARWAAGGALQLGSAAQDAHSGGSLPRPAALAGGPATDRPVLEPLTPLYRETLLQLQQLLG